MKKKILLGVVTLLIAVLGGMRAFSPMAHTNMSALLMENIEALTANESSGSGCYRTMGHCANASGIVIMCTSSFTADKCWNWTPNCRLLLTNRD